MKRITLKRFHSEAYYKRKSRWKLWLTLVLIVICIGSVVYATNLPGYQIENVAVEGAVLSNGSAIKQIAEESISGKYIFLIPHAFFWLYPKKAIREQIEVSPAILAADFNIDKNTQTLKISLAESEAKYLWCLPAPARPAGGDEAGMSEKNTCFYMDERGFIFAPAPALEGNAFLTFTGLAAGDPVGRYFLPDSQMSELLSFIKGIENLGLAPKAINAASISEVRIVLRGGAEIIVSMEKPLSAVLENLKILVSSPDFAEASGGISKIKYIDLRYGAKAFWK